MYRGFSLTISDIKDENDLLRRGEDLFSEQQVQTEVALDKYISVNGILNGSRMQEDWFPSINADIFISHSHANRDDAVKLACWLKDRLGLTVFIDSCVWGYAYELLKSIDDEYCRNATDENYNYKKRNISTSHVHMMLSVALLKMMDKTECLFFLNTPQSVTTDEIIKTTSSPWIYSEIGAAKLLQKPLEYHRKNLVKSFSEGAINERDLRMEYILDLDDFTKLGFKELNEWNNAFSQRSKRGKTALDYLYDLHSKSSGYLHS